MEFIVHNALVPSANFPGEHTTSITTWDLNKNYYIYTIYQGANYYGQVPSPRCIITAYRKTM